MVAWAPPMHEVLCLQGSGTQTPDRAGHSPPGSPVLPVSGLAREGLGLPLPTFRQGLCGCPLPRQKRVLVPGSFQLYLGGAWRGGVGWDSQWCSPRIQIHPRSRDLQADSRAPTLAGDECLGTQWGLCPARALSSSERGTRSGIRLQGSGSLGHF